MEETTARRSWKDRLFWIGALAVPLAIGGYLLFRWLSAWPEPVNPVTAEGGKSAADVAVLDFSAPFSLEPPPEGWWHRRFWTRPPMELDFVEVDGVHGLRCRTDGSGSIFGRFADLPLASYPLLRWRWRVDEPVETELDETTPEGDDHPARLFLRFEIAEPAGTEQRPSRTRAMEIIWSNGAFQPAEYKYIGDFPHYVAQSGTAALGRWVEESVDLQAVYREIWGPGDDPRLTFLAVFCDTDDTGGSSEAVFGSVRMARRNASR